MLYASGPGHGGDYITRRNWIAVSARSHYLCAILVVWPYPICVPYTEEARFGGVSL